MKASFRVLVQACHRRKHIPRVGRQEDKRVASITKVIDASRRGSLDEVESRSWQIPREGAVLDRTELERQWKHRLWWKWRVGKPVM